MENYELTTGTDNFKWIESLALEEINMEESGVVHFKEHLDPNRYLEESSVDFVNSLREKFEIYVDKFNTYRSSNGNKATIKMFKISNTVNDFMLFRNSLRLVISRKSLDLIHIGFLNNGQELYSARLHFHDDVPESAPHEIRAHIGPFNKITWRFAGEPVDVDSLVKHYLSEFIRISAQ